MVDLALGGKAKLESRGWHWRGSGAKCIKPLPKLHFAASRGNRATWRGRSGHIDPSCIRRLRQPLGVWMRRLATSLSHPVPNMPNMIAQLASWLMQAAAVADCHKPRAFAQEAEVLTRMAARCA